MSPQSCSSQQNIMLKQKERRREEGKRHYLSNIISCYSWIHNIKPNVL